MEEFDLGTLDLDLSLDLDTEEEPDLMISYTGDIEQDAVSEMSAVKAGFIARAKAEDERRRKATDSEYWFCVCFQSRDQVEEFLTKSGWAPAAAKYLDGQKLAEKIGVALTPQPYKAPRVRINSILANVAMEVK